MDSLLGLNLVTDVGFAAAQLPGQRVGPDVRRRQFLAANFFAVEDAADHVHAALEQQSSVLVPCLWHAFDCLPALLIVPLY